MRFDPISPKRNAFSTVHTAARKSQFFKNSYTSFDSKIAQPALELVKKVARKGSNFFASLKTTAVNNVKAHPYVVCGVIGGATCAIVALFVLKALYVKSQQPKAPDT